MTRREVSVLDVDGVEDVDGEGECEGVGECGGEGERDGEGLVKLRRVKIIIVSILKVGEFIVAPLHHRLIWIIHVIVLLITQNKVKNLISCHMKPFSHG